MDPEKEAFENIEVKGAKSSFFFSWEASRHIWEYFYVCYCWEISIYYIVPNKPWFLSVCGTSLLKMLWKKEKLLETSNFSFSYSIFYTFGELFCLQTLSVWENLKFFVLEWVNSICVWLKTELFR